eukprot:4937146-Pyramimonas_sp.AAC.1
MHGDRIFEQQTRTARKEFPRVGRWWWRVWRLGSSWFLQNLATVLSVTGRRAARRTAAAAAAAAAATGPRP